MRPVTQAMTAYSRAATTTPALQQIVLLYDGAISRIGEAKSAIEAGRTPELLTATSKGAAILEALAASLDHEHGGVIATNLERLYGDGALRLQRLVVEPDPTICDSLASRLQELRDAWAELAGRPDTGAPSRTAYAPSNRPVDQPAAAPEAAHQVTA